MEIWRDVVGYEGRYQVSDLGNVKSLNYHREHREKRLIPSEDTYGYAVVLLYKDGQRKQRKVHQLVAEAFLANAQNLPSINHKDENKRNNSVSNLEYCSVGYNNRYSKEVAVYQCDKHGNVVKKWGSIKEAAAGTKTKATNIGACCRGRGRSKTAGGYIWRYAV